MTLGTIRTAMTKKGISMDALHVMTGISCSRLNILFGGKGHVRESTLKSVCNALGLDYEPLRQYSLQGKVTADSHDFCITGMASLHDSLKTLRLNGATRLNGEFCFEGKNFHVTTFKELKRKCKALGDIIAGVPEIARLVMEEEAANSKKTASMPLGADALNPYTRDTLDATRLDVWSFRKQGDMRDGLDIGFGNMNANDKTCFTVGGRLFTNSEALYICGLFSDDTPQCRDAQEQLLACKSGYDAKKVVRRKSEPVCGRKDWEEFNVE